MKRSKTVVMLIGFFAVLFLFSATADAKWYKCDIKEVGGTTNNKILVKLTSTGNFSNNWYEVQGKSEKSILAVLLTAAAGKNQVNVNIIGSTSEKDSPVKGKITRCYMIVK